MENGSELLDTCLKCGAHCCKLGGVVATKDEVDAIVHRGYPNHFIQLSDDIFGMDWREDGCCAYLTDDKCTIYAVRPLGCRMFPVVQSKDNGIILVECPQSFNLSKEEIVYRNSILATRPEHIVQASSHLREKNERKLQTRSRRFGFREL